MESPLRYTLFDNLEELRTRLRSLTSGRRAIWVTESHCADLCLDRIGIEATDIVLPPGEEAKTAEQLLRLWSGLTDLGATRGDLMIALGGGALLDVAGLSAATYKRGMGLVYVPTTLLADVDASIGGKTAIDFGGVKNGVGTFYTPVEVLIAPAFLSTLPELELLSGWGEILKYSMLAGFSVDEDVWGTAEVAPSLIRRCIDYKIEVVASDPLDKGGKRQFLNLGHTLGHAFEALHLSKGEPVPHGIAVATGLVMEGYLSLRRDRLPQEELMQLARVVRDHFPPVSILCTDYEQIHAFARQDKKLRSAEEGIPVVMLDGIGKPAPAELFTPKELDEAIDFYRDFMQI